MDNDLNMEQTSNMEKSQILPLHPAQLGVFYDQKINGLAAKHNIGGYIRIRGEVNVELLDKACELCWQNSPDVRLRLLIDAVEPAQELGIDAPCPALRKLDFSHLKDGRQQAQDWMQKQMDTGMPLHQFPLFEHTLITVVPNEHLYFMRQHHISADAYTFSLRIQDLINTYELLLSEQPVQFKQRYAFQEEVSKALDYQQSEQFEEDQQFWHQRVASLQQAQWLADDLSRDLTKRMILTRSLTGLTRNELLALVKENGISIQHLVLAALSVCLNALFVKEKNAETGSLAKALIIGTPVHNRVTRKQKQMLGMLVTVVPTFVSIDEEQSLLQNARRIAKSQNEDLAHRKYPWSNVLNEIRKHHTNRSRLFDVIFNYETFHQVNAPQGLDIELHELSSAIDDTPIRLIFSDFGDRQAPSISLQASASLADFLDAERLIDAMLSLLNHAASALPLDLNSMLSQVCNIDPVNLHGTDEGPAFANDSLTGSRGGSELSGDVLKSIQTLSLPQRSLDQLMLLQSGHMRSESCLQASICGAWATFMAKYQRKSEFDCLMAEFSTAQDNLSLGDSLSSDGSLNLRYSRSLSIETNSYSDVIDSLNFVATQTVNLSKVDVEIPVMAGREDVFLTVFSVPGSGFEQMLKELMVLGAANHNGALLHVTKKETAKKSEEDDNDPQQSFDLELHLMVADSQNQRDLYPDLYVFVEFMGRLSELGRQNSPLIEIPLASDVLQKALLKQWLPKLTLHKKPNNASDSLHARFEQIAKKWPEKIAVCDDERSYSYKQLNQKANQIASLLLSSVRGANFPGEGYLIGLYFARNVDTIAAILGILKAGLAYLPLDPQYPDARLNYLVDDAQVKTVLSTVVQESSTDGQSKAVYADFFCKDVRLLHIEQADSSLYDVNSNDSAAGNFHSVDTTDQSLAYVIYTSGSTGTPKGVMQTHGNVCRLFDVTEEDFNFSEQDVWTLFHSISFDFSVWEIWGALLYGGKLVIPDYDCTRTPKQFLNLCLEHNVTVLNQTPSAFVGLALGAKTLISQVPNWSALRYVIFGGEALKKEHLHVWLQGKIAPGARLINMYGITETTVHVTFKEILPESADLTIGRAIKDQAILLLDENLRPVPAGAVGEICVAGQGLALGYKNRPELTASRFVEHPQTLPNIVRLYRSGDLAQYDEKNQEFIYLGRSDSQIQLNGFRIELGEVEQQLCMHPDILQTAVLVKKSGQESFLVAWFVAENSLNEQRLMDEFQQILPVHMLPRRYIQIPEMPLTTNGKLDRKALADLSLNDHQKNVIPARNARESLVLEICQTLLGFSAETESEALGSLKQDVQGSPESPKMGINSVLFQYGWHSVSAARAGVQLSEIFQVELPIKVLLLAPSCEEIVNALEEACGGAEMVEEIADTYMMLASLSDEEVEQILATEETG